MARTVQYILFEKEEKAKFKKLLELPEALWADFAASNDMLPDQVKDICVNYLVKENVTEADLQQAADYTVDLWRYACDNQEKYWEHEGQRKEGLAIINYAGGVMDWGLRLFIHPGGNWR